MAAAPTTAACCQPAVGQVSLVTPVACAFGTLSDGGAIPFAAAAAVNNPILIRTTCGTGGVPFQHSAVHHPHLG